MRSLADSDVIACRRRDHGAVHTVAPARRLLTHDVQDGLNMCGIAGIVGLPRDIAEPRVSEALRRLAHRGPDGEGIHADDRAVLGMRRLAIIDIAGGDQPIYNEDRGIAVVCNGEIYNYVEKLAELERRGHTLQSRSDVNVIPHFYEEDGLDVVHHLRGMFAAAIWDRRRTRLTLFRDRAGKKPLFYAAVGDGLAFASELPALLALLDRTPGHCHEALAAYLRLSFVPHPWTIYEGVWALPPGGCLTFSPGEEPKTSRYWRLPSPRTLPRTRAVAFEELEQHLHDAVAKRLRSDVPVGLFLSGGIDSGLVAAFAAAAGATDLKCFVVEVPDPELNEAPAARLVAEHLGLPVESIPLSFAPLKAIEHISLLYGQPFGDASAVPSYFVAQAARAHRKVVLNGDGGDEIFAGYRRHWLGRASPWLVPLSKPIRSVIRQLTGRVGRSNGRRTASGFAGRALRGLALSEPERFLLWTLDNLGEDDISRCFPDVPTGETSLDAFPLLDDAVFRCDGLRNFLSSDFRLVLAGDLLPKMDMATMAHGLEARSPFLDIPLVEFSSTLPERWVLNYRQTKPMLRSLARKYLPPSIVTAPKRGFEVPVARWLREDLRELVADTLLDGNSKVASYGDGAAIRRFVSGQDEFAGNRPQVTWGLLMLELFLRAPTPPPAV